MIWIQLLDELCTAVKDHDTLKLTVFLLKIINLQDLEDFQPQGIRIDFTLIQKSIRDAENAYILNNKINNKGNKIINYESSSSSSDYFQQFFLLCLDLLIGLKTNNIETQIKCQIELINLLSKRLLDDPSFYLTPIIIIAKNLRLIVFKNFPPNNNNIDYNNSSNTIVDNFTNSIQRPFKLLISNKSDNKINISAIHIFSSHLFSIYFKYNKLNAVINLYKVLSNTILNNSINLNNKIEFNPILPTKSLFDYFIGLSLLIQSNYEKSFEYFKSSYENKHSKSLNLKILFYLLPLNYLILKKLPTNKFFEKFNDLKIIQPLFNSIKELNLINFNINLEKFKFILLKFKVYALYLKFQSLIQLEIFRLTYEIYKQIVVDKSKSHIVPIKIFTTSLNILRQIHSFDISDSDTECTLCSLIATKNIKGYLSHSKQAIVLSKSSPFPTYPAQM